MSATAPTSQYPCSPYDEDYYSWLQTTADLLRQRRFAEVDIVHIIEELEDMGKRERRALESHLRNVTLHLLKWCYQPAKRGTSWRKSIRNGRIEIQKLLRDSPSLVNPVPDMITAEYPAARADAVDETGLPEKTFPTLCPFTQEQILDTDYWPE
jgi:hypothetical protein